MMKLSMACKCGATFSGEADELAHIFSLESRAKQWREQHDPCIAPRSGSAPSGVTEAEVEAAAKALQTDHDSGLYIPYETAHRDARRALTAARSAAGETT